MKNLLKNIWFQVRILIWKQNFRGWLCRTCCRALWRTISHIPNRAILWRAVYNGDQIKDDGALKSSFFRDQRGVSCDISIFSTPDKSRLGVNRPPWPEFSGLVAFRTKDVRRLTSGSDIRHNPVVGNTGIRNYAHSYFTKYLTVGQSKCLCRNCSFAIPPDLRRIYC